MIFENRISFRLVFSLFIVTLFLTRCSDQPNYFKSFPELTQNLLKDNAKNYQVYTSGQFYIHYQEDSYTAKNLEQIDAELKNGLFKTLNILGLPKFEEEVHFIIFKEVAESKGIQTGNERYFIDPSINVGYFVHNEDWSRPYFTHTLFQIIAIKEFGGAPKNPMMAVGGAFVADGNCQDYQYPFEEIGAYLFQEGKLMSFRALFRDFEPGYIRDSRAAEIQAALFYQFIYDNFGRQRIRRYWTEGIKEGIIGMGLAEVEKELVGRLRQFSQTQDIDWEEIKLNGC